MRTIVVRYFSIYGPELRKQIIWDIVRRIRAGETRIELFGTGEEIRDFIFVDDAVDLIRDAIAAATSLHMVVNGGTGMPTRIADLASLTRELLCPGVTIEFNGQERAGDPKFYQACSERAKLLGFRPRIDLRGGLGRYRSLLIHQEVPS
jgi:UDP-glucose 4-epimerase